MVGERGLTHRSHSTRICIYTHRDSHTCVAHTCVQTYIRTHEQSTEYIHTYHRDSHREGGVYVWGRAVLYQRVARLGSSTPQFWCGVGDASVCVCVYHSRFARQPSVALRYCGNVIMLGRCLPFFACSMVRVSKRTISPGFAIDSQLKHRLTCLPWATMWAVGARYTALHTLPVVRFGLANFGNVGACACVQPHSTS